MPETEISLDQVPAEAQSSFSAAPAAETEIDPLALDSDTLFQLTNQKAFDPVSFAQSNPDRATDPAAVAKLADVHSRVKEQGFRFQDLPSPGQAVSAVGHAVAGAAKQAWNYLNVFSEPIASIAGMVSGQGPEFQAELAKQNEQRLIENIAGTEQSVTGLSQLPGKALGKLGQATGLATPYSLQSQEAKNKDFFDALGKAQTAQEISKGKGGLLGNVASETVKELEARGEAPRPAEVELLAGGDPLAFLTFSRAFGLAGNVAGKALPTTTGAIEAGAGKAVAAAGGRVVQAAGKTAEVTGAGIKVAGKVAPIVGGISGAVKGAGFGSPVSGTIAGLAAGRWAGKALKEVGGGIAKAGEATAQFGKEIATGVGTTPWSQAARDVLQATPGLAADVAKGAGFDIGLVAATSESPQETEAASAFGTIFGGLHGVARAGSKVVQGQIVLPRQWGVEAKTPAYGSFKTFDNLHSQAETSAPPGQVLRANSIRQFLKGADGNAEAFLMPSAAAMEGALIERGMAPAAAKEASQQRGMFTGDLLDDAGNKRRVVLLNDADAAPHESFHILQDVLGEEANRTVDNLVYSEYAPQWEQLGQQYADRLGGTGDWRDTVLDKSGWGSAAAAEKALRDSANKIRNETGAEPKAEDAQALAQSVLTQARENGAGWRDILTSEEKTQEANKYLARELAAENFDAAFRHSGPGLAEGKSLPEKLARIAAKTASWLGAEPLAGAKTANLGVEPKFKVLQGARELGKSLIRPAEKAAPAEVLPKGKTAAPTTPFSPAQRQAAGAQAGTFAEEVAARNPKTGEVLRKIASAISSGNGLKVDYRAAPGEPGGSPNMSREARRAVIEAFREMPENVRPLWEKLNFPDRVESTKNKGFQILGWSPENYAANAQKMAKFIADIQGKIPEAKNWSPYEIDATTKSFTPDGWKKLYEDVQTFVKNQQAGGTGSGRPLQLPANAAEMRVSVPPLRESALSPLNQHAADFHNVLFNIMLPETPRVSRKGGTPGNIVAQRIAKANEPAVGPRVTSPGRVRSEAEFKGFPGERIQEVNPLRARMEQAASDAGVSFPSLIETSQRLNLDHIADVTPAPEAPVIRGVTDTLRAGFAPAEKAVEKLGREIASMDEATFKAAAGQWNGGLTGEAQRIGKLATRPEDLSSLQRLSTEAQMKMNDAKKARNMDVVFAELAKKQFFDEAVQAAEGRQFTTEAPTAQFAPEKLPDWMEKDRPRAVAERILKGVQAGDAEAQAAWNKLLIDERFGSKEEQHHADQVISWWSKLREEKEFSLTGDASSVPDSVQKAIDSTGTNWDKIATAAVEKANIYWYKSIGGFEIFQEAKELLKSGLTPEAFKKADPRVRVVLEEYANEAISPGKDRSDNPTFADVVQFAPKKKDEAKLLPADASGMSKAWILPSGKIEQLGGQWHHAWLDENPEVAAKYKLTVPKFEGNDSGTVREDALKKGFVRVNYGRNTGTLTVEARKKDWRHQKAAVEKLVEKNLDDIDNMTVHLLDETASKVVDSDSERLFRHDEDVDKMANLPFITKEGGEVRGAQFSPKLADETFGEELSKIRAGKSGGQTFNSDGTVWEPAVPSDIVTLASINLPIASAKPEAVRAALEPYAELLDKPGIVAGVFAFSKDGKQTVSVDVNAIVPQEFRDNSVAFAKENGQVSIWDAAKQEEIRTGGKGDTKLKDIDQLLSAQEALLSGEPMDFENVVTQSQELPGLGTGREFQREAIAAMTQAELKKHFPEAIIPRNKAEEIPYDIVESPLFKAAGSREAAVKSFGRKLVEFYRENERSPELKAGEKWYSEFTPLLKKEFGKDAQIFAELLAATSPNTTPDVNFSFAFDALSNWKAGKFDGMIKKFNEGFERLADGSLQKIYDRDVAAGKVKNPPAKASEATYLAHWILKHDLIPISSSGKRFGMHSEAVLKVLARRWLSQTAGPKTQNFVKNLVGTGHDATVDVWAARTMRRLGYSGSKERWRILPANSKGVSDTDFHFSQEAFRDAAKEIGVKPDALQGALWFAEKKLWSDNGWGRLSLGDFRSELKKVPALKAEFERKKNLVDAPKKKVAQMSLLDDLVRKK